MLVGVYTSPHRYRSELAQGLAGLDQRYLLRLLNTVGKLKTNTRFVVFTHLANHEAYAGWNRILVEAQGGGLATLRGKNLALNQAIEKARAEVLFSPLDAAPVNAPVPQVLYALDFAPWEPAPGKAGQGHGPNLRGVKRACTNARAIVVSSEYLRKQSLALFEAPLNKVMPALPGVDAVFEVTQPRLIGPPYILLVNDPLTADAIDGVLTAFRKRRSEFPNVFVILSQENRAAKRAWGPGVICVEDCADAHLAGLYQHAALFLYPGQHDGSALRVLEALRAGAPVVAPGSGAIGELAGDAPIYYNPLSDAALIQAVRRILNESKDRRAKRIHLGQRHAAEYTWEKCAWRILSAFKRS